jgi:FkbM family methyltransferase
LWRASRSTSENRDSAAAVNSGHAAVDILPAAVSDPESVARFHIARRNRSTNYLNGFGTTQTSGVRSTLLVPTVTLDWLAERFPPPDVIKVDVEQAEAAVLTGGARVLGLAAAIICEVADSSSVAVRDLLAKYCCTFTTATSQPTIGCPWPTPHQTHWPSATAPDPAGTNSD